MALTEVRKRVAQASYLDCAKTGEAAAMELLGTGFRELNEEPSAQVRSKRYINQKSTSRVFQVMSGSLRFLLIRFAVKKLLRSSAKLAKDRGLEQMLKETTS